MTVFYQANDQRYAAEAVIWAKQELVDAIVKAALISQTEAMLDMIIDTDKPEEITRATVNQYLRNVKDCTHDFLEDALSDLRDTIKQRLDDVAYGAAVTGIKYGLAGDVNDIEVDVTVS